jgi:hypothetical protein
MNAIVEGDMKLRGFFCIGGFLEKQNPPGREG